MYGCDRSPQDALPDNTHETSVKEDSDTRPADVWWRQHGLDAREQRFSELSQVNAGNVSKLGLVWTYNPPLPDDGFAGTPIVVDGIVYMSGTFATVFAVDAVSGEEIWFFDPQAELGHGFSSSWAGRRNHGVAVDNGKVYVGTPDCRLIALSASTGEPVWQVQSCDPTKEYAIAGAPRVANGKVYIGNGISDFGARGYVTAYDAETGAQVWRFYTVPGDPALPYENDILEMAASTWGLGWAPGGGGCAWDAIVYDAEFNHIYIGTDSGLPWNPETRSPGGGDNLFLNSIIALDADTGTYKWHYQTVPADAWDLNAANQITLTELEINGESRKVLLQAPKNGFFYVLDRATGKLLSANNYVPVEWAHSIDPDTGRPIENEGVRYHLQEDNSAHTSPTPLGAHSWHAMSYHPSHKLAYIPAQSFGATYNAGANAPLGGVAFHYYDDNLNARQDGLSAEGKHNTRGRLIAWDVLKQEARWEHFHEYGMNGGVVSTAGNLVFQGAADGTFRAHSATTGDVLWNFDTGSAIQGGPVTYMVGGEQYILVPTGSVSMTRFMIPFYGDLSGPTQLLAFKLNGDEKLPEFTPVTPPVPQPPAQTASAEQIARGAELYNAASCGLCHGSAGAGVRPGGSMPSLQYLSQETHAQFKQIVLGGARKPLGMMSFEGILREQDVDDIHAYVIDRQWLLYNSQQ
jgi:quinohemoprotein ethanol dehydrogenase